MRRKSRLEREKMETKDITATNLNAPVGNQEVSRCLINKANTNVTVSLSLAALADLTPS